SEGRLQVAVLPEPCAGRGCGVDGAHRTRPTATQTETRTRRGRLVPRGRPAPGAFRKIEREVTRRAEREAPGGAFGSARLGKGSGPATTRAASRTARRFINARSAPQFGARWFGWLPRSVLALRLGDALDFLAEQGHVEGFLEHVVEAVL